MLPRTVLDRLFLMKITVLHQLFDIRIKPRNRRFLTRLCLIGACLSNIVLSSSIEIGIGIDLLLAKLVDGHGTSDLHLQQVPLFLF